MCNWASDKVTTYVFLCWNTPDILETESRVVHQLEPTRLHPESKVSVFIDRAPSRISDNPLSFAAGDHRTPTIFWPQEVFLDVPLEDFPMPHGDTDEHTRSSSLSASASRETQFSNSRGQMCSTHPGFAHKNPQLAGIRTSYIYCTYNYLFINC